MIFKEAQRIEVVRSGETSFHLAFLLFARRSQKNGGSIHGVFVRPRVTTDRVDTSQDEVFQNFRSNSRHVNIKDLGFAHFGLKTGEREVEYLTQQQHL